MENRPELSYREVMTEMARIWNELDQEQKSPFEAQYQESVVKSRAAKEKYDLENGKMVEPKKMLGGVIKKDGKVVSAKVKDAV